VLQPEFKINQIKKTHLDLFRLSLCSSPPPSGCRPSSPLSRVNLYLCSLFVCCQFVLSHQAYKACLLVFPVLITSLFTSYPGYLHCPDPEPACHSVPYSALDYRPLPALDLSFACLLLYNKRLLFKLSASGLILSLDISSHPSTHNTNNDV
jgi:hypothetical protein